MRLGNRRGVGSQLAALAWVRSRRSTPRAKSAPIVRLPAIVRNIRGCHRFCIPLAAAVRIGEVLDSAFQIFQATLLQVSSVQRVGHRRGPTAEHLRTSSPGRAVRHVQQQRPPGWWTLYLLGAILGLRTRQRDHYSTGGVASGAPSVGSAAIMQGLRNVPANIVMVIVIVAVVLGICFVPLHGRCRLPIERGA